MAGQEEKFPGKLQEDGEAWRWQPSGSQPVRVGISACLLGKRVRFDGGHKRDAFLVETFGRWVEWVPLCPEVEVGMGVPRPAVRLVKSDAGLRLVEGNSGRDWTAPMLAYARRKVEELRPLQLSGFVLKKDSPSCGMERVKVYGSGMPRKEGRGLFAQVLMEAFPLLPVEEEGRLCDPRLRENFVERVFAFHRLQSLQAAWSLGNLVAFHTAHKFQLLAHSPALHEQLGQLVAQAKNWEKEDLWQRYSQLFMACLATPATRPRHVNVLQHMAGYFKKRLAPKEKAELLGLIRDYGKGLVPLVVPVSLLRYLVRVLGEPYLAGQTYLEPHPKELMLRNHV
jgi:uncharacterized protein YbgA (DUF1722 family)/uncharacterized protein YbbK (DUF523 family)